MFVLGRVVGGFPAGGEGEGADSGVPSIVCGVWWGDNRQLVRTGLRGRRRASIGGKERQELLAFVFDRVCIFIRVLCEWICIIYVIGFIIICGS